MYKVEGFKGERFSIPRATKLATPTTTDSAALRLPPASSPTSTAQRPICFTSTETDGKEEA